jgi:5-methyltetrahydrofolate--homocysteine methyltransferase
MSEIYAQLSTAVLEGNKELTPSLVQKALDQGLSPKDILDNGMVAGMNEVGARFKRGDMFVPEVLMSAEAMQTGLNILRPHLTASGAKLIGKIVMGTVKGDLHDIGKNLVSMMLEGAGFKVMDLGVDLGVEKLIEQVKALQPDVLGLSALLTTTMPEMQKVIAELKAQGLRTRVKVMVGGAPVDRAFSEKIGADGYGSNATEAVELARRFAGAKA